MAALEIVEAVQKSLEKDGVLQSIRAQLRASILNIISSNPTNFPKNEKLVNFCADDEGLISLILVKDLLEKLNLQASLSTFNCETNLLETLEQFDEASIKAKLNLSHSFSEILLMNLVQSRFSTPPEAESRTESYKSEKDEEWKQEPATPVFSPKAEEKPNQDFLADSKPSTAAAQVHHDLASAPLDVSSSFEVESSFGSNKRREVKEGNVQPIREDLNTERKEASESEEEQEGPEESESDLEDNGNMDAGILLFSDKTEDRKLKGTPFGPGEEKREASSSEAGASANVVRLNQGSRSRLGWDNVQDNNEYEIVDNETATNSRLTSSRGPGQPKFQGNNLDVQDMEDSGEFEEEDLPAALQASYRSNQDEESDAGSYEEEKSPASPKFTPVKAATEVEDDYGDDFEDDDPAQMASPLGQRRDNNPKKPLYSALDEDEDEEEIMSVEEELSVGSESSKESAGYTFGAGREGKASANEVEEQQMTRSRSGVLPAFGEETAMDKRSSSSQSGGQQGPEDEFSVGGGDDDSSGEGSFSFLAS